MLEDVGVPRHIQKSDRDGCEEDSGLCEAVLTDKGNFITYSCWCLDEAQRHTSMRSAGVYPTMENVSRLTFEEADAIGVNLKGDQVKLK